MTTVRTVLNLLSYGLSYKKIRLQTGASRHVARGKGGR